METGGGGIFHVIFHLPLILAGLDIHADKKSSLIGILCCCTLGSFKKNSSYNSNTNKTGIRLHSGEN